MCECNKLSHFSPSYLRIREANVRALPVRGAVTRIEFARDTPKFAYFRIHVQLNAYRFVRYANLRTTYSKNLHASSCYNIESKGNYFK
jgi:hypothetical protein